MGRGGGREVRERRAAVGLRSLLLRRLVDLRGDVGRCRGKEPVAEDCKLAGAVLDRAAGLRREGAAIAARSAIVIPVPAHDG